LSFVAIITAGGSGKRFGSNLPKQLLSFGGKTIIEHSVSRFLQDSRFSEIIITAPERHIDDFAKRFIQKPIRIVVGGNERQDSVRRGLEAAQTEEAIVFIHDGVRPFISLSEIKALADAAEKFGAAALGHPLTHTIKKMDEDQFAISTPDRRNYWEIYTPQCFKLETIRRLHRQAQAEHLAVTDDAALYEHYCGKVKLIESQAAGLKITFPQDLALAEFWLRQISEDK